MFSESLLRAIEALNLGALALDDPKAILGALKDFRAKFHPDKFGGTFQTVAQRQTYERVSELILRCESEIDQYNARTEALTNATLVRQITPTVLESPAQRKEIVTVLENDVVVNGYKKRARTTYLLPKITSAALASVCLVLVSLLNHFKENPLYQKIVSYYARPEISMVSNLAALQIDASRIQWVESIEPLIPKDDPTFLLIEKGGQLQTDAFKRLYYDVDEIWTGEVESFKPFEYTASDLEHLVTLSEAKGTEISPLLRQNLQFFKNSENNRNPPNLIQLRQADIVEESARHVSRRVPHRSEGRTGTCNLTGVRVLKSQLRARLPNFGVESVRTDELRHADARHAESALVRPHICAEHWLRQR